MQQQLESLGASLTELPLSNTDKELLKVHHDCLSSIVARRHRPLPTLPPPTTSGPVPAAAFPTAHIPRFAPSRPGPHVLYTHCLNPQSPAPSLHFSRLAPLLENCSPSRHFLL